MCKMSTHRLFSRVSLDKREQKRLFLLKFRAMHDLNHMTWDDCAAVYESETGKPISGDHLRLKVKRASKDAGFVRVSEFPEKIVVSVFELSFFGCFWCAIRKFFTKIGGFWNKKGEK